MKRINVYGWLIVLGLFCNQLQAQETDSFVLSGTVKNVDGTVVGHGYSVVTENQRVKSGWFTEPRTETRGDGTFTTIFLDIFGPKRTKVGDQIVITVTEKATGNLIALTSYTGTVEDVEKLEAGASVLVQGVDTNLLIPDLNLRTAIEEALGKNAGGPITDVELGGLTELSAGFSSISDLTGLQYLTNLTDLSLQNNQISNISVLSNLTNLTSLILSGNPLSAAAAFVIKPLKDGGTDVRHDTIPDLLIPDLNLRTAIEEALGKNAGGPITDVELGGLTELSAGFSSISDLTGLQYLTNLTDLSLRNNQISNISSLSNLTNLTSLDLGYNQISDISSLSNLTNLTVLYLLNNQISDISSLSNLTNLTTLHLLNNQISDISPLVDKIADSGYLNLQNNPLNNTALSTHIPALQTRGITVDYDPPEGQSTFFTEIDQGINLVSVPLNPSQELTARDMLNMMDATLIIHYNREGKYFQGFTSGFPGNGFVIEGDLGYIINARQNRVVKFYGTSWINQPPDERYAAPASLTSDNTWAFMVSVDSGLMTNLNFSVKNQRTGNLAHISQPDSNSAKQAIWADWSRQSVVEVGDLIEIYIHDQFDQKVGTLDHQVSQSDIDQAYVDIQVQPSDILPGKTQLLTNYPNPFNPETWIPYQLNSDAEVSIQIYGVDGNLVRRLEMGYQSAGYYHSQSRSGYWNGKNNNGEQVVSGVYFYQLLAGDYTDTRKMVILK